MDKTSELNIKVTKEILEHPITLRNVHNGIFKKCDFLHVDIMFYDSENIIVKNIVFEYKEGKIVLRNRNFLDKIKKWIKINY